MFEIMLCFGQLKVDFAFCYNFVKVTEKDGFVLSIKIVDQCTVGFHGGWYGLTLSGREILLKISRVDGGWVWPVQS